MKFHYLLSSIILTIGLQACSTPTTHAPISDRNVNNKPAPANTTNASTAPVKPASKDWRPDNYIVKKGDTLYSLGLEYGYDYKEVAAANNIPAPYNIKIGQSLVFPSTKSNNVTTTSTTTSATTKPIKTEPAVVSSNTTNTTKPNDSTTKPITPADDAVTWVWPTSGKVTAGFNEASNKGINIAGTLGQAVNAAAAGKVIYSGSDLRGYGKLVIIKHNKTYLSVYAHNSKILVKEGQQVTSGQKIAEMGNTESDSVKLHFEIRQQGKSVDPAKLLPQS